MLITNIGQLVTPIGRRSLCGRAMRKLHILRDSYMQIEEGTIVKVRPMHESCQSKDEAAFDARGGLVIPGLVDPHTHAVFYGTREDEFLARCQGERYSKGILTSVEKVRKASESQIHEFSRKFLIEMTCLGTTTVEIKSGYGLNTENELKLLRVIGKLKQELSVEIVSTFCGAHAVPAGVKTADYIEEILRQMIPQIRRQELAEFSDVFCEQGFFSVAESREILSACRQVGMGVKVHADELSPLGGAELAAELGAVSADHLLHVTTQGIEALKRASVVAVLLPGTAFSLNAQYAEARKMIDEGLAVALGTDFNPGTCLVYSMFFVMALAVLRMKMTIEETLTAATLNAAAALRRADRTGSLEPGKRADALILDLENYGQIPYFIGHEREFVRAVICGGEIVYEKTNH